MGKEIILLFILLPRWSGMLWKKLRDMQSNGEKYFIKILLEFVSQECYNFIINSGNIRRYKGDEHSWGRSIT